MWPFYCCCFFGLASSIRWHDRLASLGVVEKCWRHPNAKSCLGLLVFLRESFSRFDPIHFLGSLETPLDLSFFYHRSLPTTWRFLFAFFFAFFGPSGLRFHSPAVELWSFPLQSPLRTSQKEDLHFKKVRKKKVPSNLVFHVLFENLNVYSTLFSYPGDVRLVRGKNDRGKKK